MLLPPYGLHEKISFILFAPTANIKLYVVQGNVAKFLCRTVSQLQMAGESFEGQRAGRSNREEGRKGNIKTKNPGGESLKKKEPK